MDFDIQWLDSVPSTNQWLKDRCAETPELQDGTLMAAREQTQGRGRYDREWISAPGRDLCFSALIKTEASPEQTASLSMAAALAVDDMLQTQRIPSRPKWPNDVLVGAKKICGILTERLLSGNDPVLILGIGLNVNMDREALAAIGRPATSMREETGKTLLIEHVLDALLSPLAAWVERWRRGGFEAIRVSWTERTALIGRHMVIHERDRSWSGVLESFGACGQVMLRCDNGQRQEIWAGEME